MQTLEITNKERLATLKALPLPVGAQFSIQDVTNANHKPHPYTIGSKHMEASSGVIDESLCRRVKCAYPGCSTPYEDHTSDTVCFIQVTAAGELKDVAHLNEFLVSIKDKATELGVDGFAFVQAPKTYEPKEIERITLAQPTGSTEPSKLTKQQYKSYGPRPVEGYGKGGAAIWAHVRYDDECGNGHNTFAITGTVRVPKQRDAAAGGCLHDDLALAFPELAPFIKWHLCSSDGPSSYIANTVYHASNRDCWGKAAGEASSFEHAVQFGENPIKHKIGKKFSTFLQEHAPKEVNQFDTTAPRGFDFEVLPLSHDNRPGDNYKYAPKYTFGGFADKWHEAPFDTEGEALDFLKALQTCKPQFLTIPTAWSEGKARELDNARSSAVWPEATDEELTALDLKEKLEARLPALLIEFRAAVESLGFTW